MDRGRRRRSKSPMIRNKTKSTSETKTSKRKSSKSPSRRKSKSPRRRKSKSKRQERFSSTQSSALQTLSLVKNNLTLFGSSAESKQTEHLWNDMWNLLPKTMIRHIHLDMNPGLLTEDVHNGIPWTHCIKQSNWLSVVSAILCMCLCMYMYVYVYVYVHVYVYGYVWYVWYVYVYVYGYVFVSVYVIHINITFTHTHTPWLWNDILLSSNTHMM